MRVLLRFCRFVQAIKKVLTTRTTRFRRATPVGGFTRLRFVPRVSVREQLQPSGSRHSPGFRFPSLLPGSRPLLARFSRADGEDASRARPRAGGGGETSRPRPPRRAGSRAEGGAARRRADRGGGAGSSGGFRRRPGTRRASAASLPSAASLRRRSRARRVRGCAGDPGRRASARGTQAGSATRPRTCGRRGRRRGRCGRRRRARGETPRRGAGGATSPPSGGLRRNGPRVAGDLGADGASGAAAAAGLHLAELRLELALFAAFLLVLAVQLLVVHLEALHSLLRGGGETRRKTQLCQVSARGRREKSGRRSGSLRRAPRAPRGPAASASPSCTRRAPPVAWPCTPPRGARRCPGCAAGTCSRPAPVARTRTAPPRTRR